MANKKNLKQGLYNPKNEHDSCGVGFIANIHGTKSHRIVQQGLEILTNLTPVSYTHLTLPTIYSV